jgi:methylenetetrahydrofolate dehydrogenase (NAD+)
MGTKVEVSELAEKFRGEIRERLASLGLAQGPLIVGFLANGDPAAKKYAAMTRKACEKDGIRFELREVERTDLEDELFKANKDPSVHGIMIYYPAFGKLFIFASFWKVFLTLQIQGNKPSFYGGSMDDYLRDSVDYTKDVEGLCFTYRYNLYHNIRYTDKEKKNKCVVPCTSLSILKILDWLGAYDASLPEGERLLGKNITIFNRSEIVGRPLAAMLANDGN